MTLADVWAVTHETEKCTRSSLDILQPLKQLTHRVDQPVPKWATTWPQLRWGWTPQSTKNNLTTFYFQNNWICYISIGKRFPIYWAGPNRHHDLSLLTSRPKEDLVVKRKRSESHYPQKTVASFINSKIPGSLHSYHTVPLVCRWSVVGKVA